MTDVRVSFAKTNVGKDQKTNKIKTTKYTWYEFLPRNTFEQLHKFGNCYFLLISVIMYLGEKTPLYVGTIKAFSTLGVLLMVMAFTATMDLLDDLRRGEADREINKSIAHYWQGTEKLVQKIWENVAVGDILVVRQDEEFPADLVLFFSSGEGGNCYVSTANLDGETNLKLKSAPKVVQAACTPSTIHVGKLEEDVLQKIPKLKGWVVAEAPNGNIHDFKGSLSLHEPMKNDDSLGARQLLLRGTRLRNTAFVVGIVVYCGANTRMIRNSRPAPAKVSSLEFFTNTSMKLILVAQACLALVSSLCFCYDKWYFQTLWYYHVRDDLWLPDLPAYWLTFFTMYSNLMPISLYPTKEFCNVMQSFFIRNDKYMIYHAKDFDDGVPFAARARSSNLCQELGQIKYLFSDKTGTLTQNVMELKRVSIGFRCRKYGHLVPLEVGFNGKEDLQVDRQEGEEAARQIESFLEVLAVAHTVMVNKGKDGQIRYEAESPDEDALVTAARNLGWSFESRKGDTLTCNELSVAGSKPPKVKMEKISAVSHMMSIGRKKSPRPLGHQASIKPQPSKAPEQGFLVEPGTIIPHSYTVLATNAFTSSRKRMSILVKKDDKEHLLLMKGADNVMLERAKKECFDSKALLADLNEFSREGLRTLVIGQKKLDPETVNKFLTQYKKANSLTAGREEALDGVADWLEKDIEVLGATAIEDKLQDQVPETIEKIRMAGIKLWVLTGDKLETAREIGYSTKVLVAGMNIQTVDDGEEGGDKLDDAITKLQQKGGTGRAMMVTGKALAGIVGSSQEKKKFVDIAQKCDVLIACRVSPMQKAECVRIIREAAPKGQEPITAAIGDGANDVPMIQEAQVGIGIAGREGRQSVNNSDFAIGQFQYLQRLLLVHGRWNYLRACKFTLFTFWRNMVQVLIMFSYTFLSGFSGTVIFEDWLRLSFNAFGSLPVLAVGSFDQDVEASVAYTNPELYVVGRNGEELNVIKTLQTFVAATFHATIIVCVTLLAYPGMDLWGGGDFYTFGSAVYTCLIIELTYRVVFLTCSHNKYTLCVAALTLFGYVIFLLCYPCVSFIANIFQPNMYMVPVYMVWNASFWVCILAIPMIGWTVDSFTNWAKHRLFPDAVDGLKLDDEDGQKKTLLPDDRERANGSANAKTLNADQKELFQKHVDLTPYGQQELKSWRIRLSPQATMKIIISCGIALLLLGLLVQYYANDAAQVRVIYHMAQEGKSMIVSEIPWGTMDEEVFDRKRHCDEHPKDKSVLTCNVIVPRQMRPPLLVYYGVGPFYQNIVSYLKSEVSKELMGKHVDIATRQAKCLDKRFLVRNGNNIVPCGAKAGSLFNDTLELHHQDGRFIDISKEGVAWKSDVMRYNNPEDYPQRRDTTWLYQLFPNVVKREEGVENEAFAAWMRPSALGRVWNHYGWISQKLNKGETISFKINSSFVAPLGSKMFVITERNAFGGRHTELGIALMISGIGCFVLFFIVCLDQRGPDGPASCVR